ncbi:uncharacterized protein si:ch211-57n23.1 [Lampris incognitus]|uniref:uncharacterized protein si:ch211-57n23.1 n=1 Tax=Lampris incognitus TaxID=2546036 RepID=UPI0024B48349|nr:uncharacterized protein si:ch211-57n23.1 [Lampris incognitus]XP_056154366.1 uncharacterized protein si:ch211-57n23.1 [Lampris incognitus]
MLLDDMTLGRLCLSCCFVLWAWRPVAGAGAAQSGPGPAPDSGEPFVEEWEWGSGFSVLEEFLHSLPADSPFVAETPGKPVNCTQRFWLPSASSICWDDIVGPEEFAKSRLLVLQNRAALQAVSTTSGVEEGGVSYKQQAREEVQGILSDHQSMAETMGTMQEVFVSLEEKRKEGKEQWDFSSIRKQIASTRDAIEGKEGAVNLLERQFFHLEKTLFNIQQRLTKLIVQ